MTMKRRITRYCNEVRDLLIEKNNAYQFYFHYVLPLLGGLISGDRKAYSYLPNSVGTFPQRQDFLELMEAAGFTDTRVISLTLGICAIYQGNKSD